MRRTNIYLDDDQLQALKHLAVESRQSVADLVRRAVDAYLQQKLRDTQDWADEFTKLIARIQSRIPPDLTPEEIEADISAAREEVREAHRSSRARGH